MINAIKGYFDLSHKCEFILYINEDGLTCYYCKYCKQPKIDLEEPEFIICPFCGGAIFGQDLKLKFLPHGEGDDNHLRAKG